MTGVLTVTLNPSLDVSASVDRVEPDHKLPTTIIDAEPGGGGINVSRVLHRFGVATQAVVPLGGIVAQEVATRLANEGIVVRPVPRAADARRCITIFETDTGEHYRFVSHGQPMTEPEWRAVLAEVADADPPPQVVVCSGSLPPGVPPDLVTELTWSARQVGARVVVDTKGPALAAAVDAGVDLIKPNRRELAGLVDHDGDPAHVDVAGAARALVDRGVGMVVVSLGPDGAMAVTADEVIEVASPEVAVVSAVGAGDSMVAGLLAGLAEGRTPAGAVRLGVATGAAACLTPGSGLALADDARHLDAELAAG